MPTLVAPRSPRQLVHPRALLAFLLLFACWHARAQAPDLKPTGYINDYAGVLSPQAKAQLEALATEVKQKTQAEIAVAVVKSLEGDTAENYANLLAESWGVGDQEDRGALLLLAIDDRQSRLEIGYGLEPIITDGTSGEILDQMTPYLRQADYDSAVAVGVLQLAQIIAQEAGVQLTGVSPRPQRRSRGRGGSWWPLIFILPFLLLPRRRRYGGWHGNAVTTAWMLGSLGGFGRRGGFGGGGLGGGGFGGFGGGGFGGGGASRSW